MEYRKEKVGEQFLMGNEAIGRSLLEHGAFCVASYPGTPASEILEAVIHQKEKEKRSVHTEWSINEKAAFEVAIGCSLAGRRAAVAMKQVGLNVASDPMMSSAYTGIKGGFVIISADDPGPHSSQTEQDSRAFAAFAKIPVLDPSSPAEAAEMIGEAFELSENYGLPVVVRPTTRVCHARQMVPLYSIPKLNGTGDFTKDPHRWAATPRFRYLLHQQLNQKMKDVGTANLKRIGTFVTPKRPGGFAILGSGVAYSHVHDVLSAMGLLGEIDLIKIDMPYPLDAFGLDEMLKDYSRILVFEETYPVIEGQLLDRRRVRGKRDGTVPSEGELTPDSIRDILNSVVGRRSSSVPKLKQTVEKPPRLCPGCPHRAAFYAIKKSLPKGIYPGDIGCYTLGIHMGVVDTCLCMGAGINQAAGLCHAYRGDGDRPPIVATIGDSTFLHSGITALMNSVHQGARFVLVILDNSTTAMTGGQPTLANMSGSAEEIGPAADIKQIVRSCGTRFLEEIDPYDVPAMLESLKRAEAFTRAEDGGVAVIISKRPCVLYSEKNKTPNPVKFSVHECKKCGLCTDAIDCPAIEKEGKEARIIEEACTGCGLCFHLCPTSSIRKEENSLCS
jgi:indolepyruvate ferredoxin oxidoreductase, alpha subunit